MTLVVFDLDGTLLDKTSKISGYTADTLALMRAKRIPYTCLLYTSPSPRDS